MLIVIAVATGAAFAVLAYNRVRERDPELASASMRRVHQLAAVVVVITSSVEKLFDALGTVRPTPLYAATSYGGGAGYPASPGRGTSSYRPLFDDFEEEQ